MFPVTWEILRKYSHLQLRKTGREDRTGQDREGQDRAGQDRIGQDRTG